MTTEDNIDYDPPTATSQKANESEKKETRKSGIYNRGLNSETDKEEAQNTVQQVITSERGSKKRASDVNVLMYESQDNDARPSTKSKKNSSAASTSVNPDSLKKKRKTDTKESSSSKRSKPASDDSMRPDELDDYEVSAGIRGNEADEQESGEIEQNKNKSSTVSTSLEKKGKANNTVGPKTSEMANPLQDDFIKAAELDDFVPNHLTEDSPRVELKPFRGSLLDNEHLNSMDGDIQVMKKPPASTSTDIEIIEVPIKTENPGSPQQEEMPTKMKNPVEEEVKPKFTSQLKLLEALKTLVIHLDINSLSHVKSKICRKIWKLGESDKGISNEEMIPAMELLFGRIANHSVLNLPEKEDSFNLIQFLCYFKAAIISLNSECLNSLLEKVRERIKEPTSKDKSIPVEKIANVLQTTLDVIGF